MSFKKAGNTPCETPGCTVLDRIDELKKIGVEIDSWWMYILPHSACRISSLSPDNQEYIQRIQKIALEKVKTP